MRPSFQTAERRPARRRRRDRPPPRRFRQRCRRSAGSAPHRTLPPPLAARRMRRSPARSTWLSGRTGRGCRWKRSPRRSGCRFPAHPFPGSGPARTATGRSARRCPACSPGWRRCSPRIRPERRADRRSSSCTHRRSGPRCSARPVTRPPMRPRFRPASGNRRQTARQSTRRRWGRRRGPREPARIGQRDNSCGHTPERLKGCPLRPCCACAWPPEADSRRRRCGTGSSFFRDGRPAAIASRRRSAPARSANRPPGRLRAASPECRRWRCRPRSPDRSRSCRSAPWCAARPPQPSPGSNRTCRPAPAETQAVSSSPPPQFTMGTMLSTTPRKTSSSARLSRRAVS